MSRSLANIDHSENARIGTAAPGLESSRAARALRAPREEGLSWRREAAAASELSVVNLIANHGEEADEELAGHEGAYRVDVEDVPRLPTFPAAWTLSDPRGRPYFVFWTSPFDDTLTRVLRMESVQKGTAVQLTIPDVGVFQIPIVRRPLPRRGGFAILYRCPGCSRARRHLYLRSLVIGRLVDYQGPLCQACAGRRWPSQGRYIGALHRAFRAGLAVSDPRLILDEFPDLVRAR